MTKARHALLLALFFGSAATPAFAGGVEDVQAAVVAMAKAMLTKPSGF
ncbi:MAG TPA: hypothetical protein VIJ85_06540 [Rhizomicrobium sp.]